MANCVSGLEDQTSGSHISYGEQLRCFCPADSCNFTAGYAAALLEHVEQAHEYPVVKFRYGADFKVYVTPTCQLTFLTAQDDNSVFALRSMDAFSSGGRLFWVVHLGNPGEGVERRTHFGYDIMAEGFNCVSSGVNGTKTVRTIDHGNKVGTFISGSSLEFGDDVSVKLCVPHKFKQPGSGKIKLSIRIGVKNTPRLHLDSNDFTNQDI